MKLCDGTTVWMKEGTRRDEKDNEYELHERKKTTRKTKNEVEEKNEGLCDSRSCKDGWCIRTYAK